MTNSSRMSPPELSVFGSIAANDPRCLGVTRSPSFGVGIRFDPAMKKVRKAYEAETRKRVSNG